MDAPETRYAMSGDVAIAFQQFGSGTLDLVWTPGAFSNIGLTWADPSEVASRFYAALGEFARVILFDKRGTGLSDRVAGIPDLETRMDDIRAVMDAADVERAAIAGVSEGGPMAVLFAATYPERTQSLILYGTAPKFVRGPGFSWQQPKHEYLAGSTAKAAELGDRGWRDVLEAHHGRVRREPAEYRGVELDTAGDGFFARCDGPARAIRCASAITASVRDLGIEVRAGLHTGECELHENKVAGIAVSIGARIASQAGPGEVLVSQTVKDLVAGSGIAFEDRGTAELKGVPEQWRLYAVADA